MDQKDLLSNKPNALVKNHFEGLKVQHHVGLASCFPTVHATTRGETSCLSCASRAD